MSKAEIHLCIANTSTYSWTIQSIHSKDVRMHIIDILPRIQASHVTKLCYDIFFVKAVVKLRYSLCCICCQFSHSRQYTTDEGIYQTAAEAATALHARLVFSLLNPCMGFKEGAFPVCVLIVLGTYMYTTLWKLLHALLCLDFLVSLLPEARKVQDCTWIVPNRLSY